MNVLQRIFRIGAEEEIVMVGLLCWNLWHRRNNRVWNNINTSSFGVKARTYNMLVDWNKACEVRKQGSRTHQSGGRSWERPPVGWIKINTDAACLPGSDHVGVGCVIRNDKGEFIRARSSIMRGRMQPREAEAMGMKEALAWTKNWRRNKCIFECDAKLVVEAINGGQGNTYFHTIIEDCIDILKHFQEVLVVFVYRSANTVAHLLAKAVYSSSGLEEWLNTVPGFILLNLENDI